MEEKERESECELRVRMKKYEQELWYRMYDIQKTLGRIFDPTFDLTFDLTFDPLNSKDWEGFLKMGSHR